MGDFHPGAKIVLQSSQWGDDKSSEERDETMKDNDVKTMRTNDIFLGFAAGVVMMFGVVTIEENYFFGLFYIILALVLLCVLLLMNKLYLSEEHESDNIKIIKK